MAVAEHGRSIEAEAAAGELLFHDATIYFVLISGLLYALALNRRPVLSYWRERALHLAVPYTCVTGSLMLIAALPLSWHALSLVGIAHGIELLASALASGTAFYHLWYMPVAILLACAGPMLFRLASNRRTAWLTACIAAVPILISREGTSVQWQTICFFTGVYVVGLWLGIDHERKIDRLGELLPVLAALALASTACLALVQWLGLHRIAHISLRESLYFVQKISCSFMLLLLFRRSRLGCTAAVRWLASASFAIFLVHAPIIGMLVAGSLALGAIPSSWFGAAVAMLGLWATTLILSAVLVRSMTAIFGSRSRLIVGA